MSDGQSCSWSAFHSASRPSSKFPRRVSTFLTHRGLYPAEVLSFENRSKGLSLQGWCSNALTTINTFGLPPALGALGYIGEYIVLFSTQADPAVYYIFAAWDIIGIAVIWLFAVETKQLSLEEMDEVFEARRPKLRSFELAQSARERVKKEKEAGRSL